MICRRGVCGLPFGTLSWRLTIAVPGDLELMRVVTSYGYFVLAPNQWDGDRRALHRPLRDAAGRVVHCRIRQRGDEAGRPLVIDADRAVEGDDRRAIRGQVRRMLRVDMPVESVERWYALNPAAARERYGRLFRSPTLFEDMIKTITGCNVSWPNTIAMNRRLVERVARDGGFPTAAMLARWSPSKLKAAAKVGYRAERIIRLAREVDSGRLDLAWFESPDRDSDELYEALRAIHGIGDYAASNLLQCLGHFDRLAIDSETIRHFRQYHGHDGGTRDIERTARTHYDRYAPFQFLAYWHELWRAYERRIGHANGWSADHSAQLTANRSRT